MEALKGGVTLGRGGFGGSNHKGFLRIQKNQVGVIANGDVSFGEQTKTPGRIPAQQLSHLMVRHSPFAALTENTREKVLRPTETRLGQEDILWISGIHFLLC